MIILFLIIAILAFTLPGIYLLEQTKLKLTSWEKLILGSVVGLIFFSLLSYFLLLIHLHLLLPAIILILALLQVKKIPGLIKNLKFFPKGRLILFLLMFIVGLIGQLLVIAPSGIYLNNDLVFWSSHGHDGLWHLNLMQSYQKGYPLLNPIIAGERVYNYHFFSDIAPADFNQFFKFSGLDLYFRFFPLIYSLLLGALSFLLGAKMGRSFLAGLMSLSFTLFAGSFGYIVTYLQNHTLGGETVFWASQPQSSIGNPPQIAAFIIVLSFLYLFTYFLENNNRMLFFICVILAGSLAEFKIYGGIVLLTSLGLTGVWQILKEKKFSILLLSISSGLLSALLYFPNASNSGGFLIFEPWWYIRTMIVAPNRLNWLDLELRRQTYLADHNYKRVLQIEVTGLLIFFFGNLGMRFLALCKLLKIKNLFKDYYNLAISSIITISLVIPLLFLQKGVATNTIQFLQYFLIMTGIVAGVAVADFFRKIKSPVVIGIIGLIIFILAVPTQVGLIQNFYSRPPFAKISRAEITALQFIKQQTPENSIILTPAFNKYYQNTQAIPEIWAWSDTSYVSALSQRSTYLADTEQVDIMGYDYKNRLAAQQEIFTQEDPKLFTKEINDLRVNYLYFPIPQKPLVDLTKTPLKPIFSNSAMEIWQVK